MAAFRKFIPALAVLVLVLGLVSTASAQTPFQCTATTGTATPLLRSEGMTELTGDIVLNCIGGTPTLNSPAGTIIPQANINVFLNTAVTSRLLNSSNQSEALLMVDDPGVGDQRICTAVNCPIVATSAVSGVPGANPFKTYVNGLGSTIAPINIWPGTVSGNAITFNGIPIEPPGSTGTRIYRITNIRANASAVAPGGFGTPGQVVAQLSTTPITAGASFTINNATQTIGFVQSGLTFSVYAFSNATSTGVPTIQQCANFRTSSGVPAGLVDLRFAENFTAAFKPRSATSYTAFAGVDVSPTPVSQNTPGLIYNSESGFYNSGLTAPFNAAGLADFGTRLRVTFSSIPNGVSLYVTTTNLQFDPSTGRATSQTLTSPTTNSARLVGTETGFFFPVQSSSTVTISSITYTYFPVTLTNGNGTAVWEVMGADPAVTNTYDFGVLAIANANAANNLPAAGTGNASGSFAPAPPAFVAADGAKAQGTGFAVPRFADTGSAKKVLGVALCRTILLFPYVTNIQGFDTGLAISNTTQDPLGTAPQSGTCDLNFYGSNAPTVLTTGAIAGGGQYVNTAGGAAPGFQGYVIAICNFQYAHGFAFVSDVGARNIAMGYLALVMPDGGRTNVNAGLATANGTGELLGQ